MRRQRKAKIVATIGPASTAPERLQALFLAGVDVFRLNFSHGSHEEHRERVEAIRDIERRLDRPIGILLDLQGPKLRIGMFADDAIELGPGGRFRLDLDDRPGDGERVCLPHPEIFAAAHPGMELLLDDGKVRLRVVEAGSDHLLTEVITAGPLSDRKGVNVPDAVLPLSPVTAKDRRDLAFGLDLGVDWVGLSFVQTPADLAEARKLIGGRARLMAKLEKPAALGNLDELVDMADGLMVARGDLGVELPPEEVPSAQKRIVRRARAAGKPVIVATQMLDSMVQAPAPTRAEASDVATAIYDGVDAVMLSAETAVGRYPMETVAIMSRIIERVEADELYRTLLTAGRTAPEPTTADAISASARQCAETLAAASIVTYTNSGATAYRVARERPCAAILGLSPHPATARQLSLAWGVHPVTTADIEVFADMVAKATRIARQEEFAAPGDKLVIVAGVPFGTPGATNILRIARVEKG